MGFGFNLLFVIILVPLTGILLLTWLLTRKKIFGIIIGCVWLGIFGLAFFSTRLNPMTAKNVLDKKDYYGQYIIDRAYFPGKQTDWQYNSFRFEIKQNDSIYFYLIDKYKILKIYRGVIRTTRPYNSERLIIYMEQPTHHILTSNPTTHRTASSFCLVFYSSKFKNVYFKKGKWETLD